MLSDIGLLILKVLEKNEFGLDVRELGKILDKDELGKKFDTLSIISILDELKFHKLIEEKEKNSF